jgi:hypothetical protein
MSKENTVAVEELQSGMSNSANKEPDSVKIQESASAAIEPSDSKQPASGQGIVPTVVQRATGPRTKLGKERSGRNSLKHGIFSRAAILQEDERWEQFDSLLQGLRKDLQPMGMLENMLVDKLASLMWRYRRMLVAERAEIRLGKWINPLTAEREKQQREEAVILFSSMERPGPGLLSRSENPLILKRIVELLKSLSFLVQIRGFDPESDGRILKMVFGEGKLPELMLMLYKLCSNPGTLVEDDKDLKEFDLPPEGRKAKFLEILKKYIESLEQIPELKKLIPARAERLETFCSGVPETPRLDRLLRYEASLERSFDRTLSQLERLQRLRLGQPVLPKLEVQHSLS